MTRLCTALSVIALAAPLVRAQQFDVASIRLNRSEGAISKENSAHGKLTANNVSVKDLIRFAFHVYAFQIAGGPGWLDTNRYDIAAETDPAVNTDEQFRPALQALLADRFQLKFHREMKPIPIYSLVVAKNGPKLIRHTGGGEFSTDSSRVTEKASITQTSATMANLADALTRNLERKVVDNTGLSGVFDLKVEWSPEQADSSGPSIFTALQEQAGLGLEAAKASAEVILIDSVAKPSEN